MKILAALALVVGGRTEEPTSRTLRVARVERETETESKS